MFKSIFSRMLVSFTAILLLCILLLVLVVSSGLFQESREKEFTELGVAANEIGFFLEEMQRITSLPAPLLLQQNESFHSNLIGIADLTEADITIMRVDGVVMTSSADEWKTGDRMLPAETVTRILEDDSSYIISDLDGVLDRRRLNSFAMIRDSQGTPVYLIVVTSEKSLYSELANSVTQRTVVVAIWIFFAAMVITFFISRRITDPIKRICEVAREYAQGRFSARVKVDGQDEITELSQAFNNMASGLAAHEENRNTFVANVSHDLRTPMTTISGFVDGILDGTIPPQEQEKYLKIISGEVHRLSRLVNTLLEVSRLDSGKSMHMSEFNVTETARQILISLMGKIETKRLDIEFQGGEDDVFVLADSDAIHQVLYNLLDNAVKFTPEKGTVSIAVSAKGKKALLCVRNTGEGIPDQEIPHIFERFYKSDRSRGLDKTGTGLGLYIVKTILDKHGESINVESVPGKYTEFRFGLSLSAGKPKQKSAEAIESISDRKERV